MLLRLERYPCRINYATGILEARVQKYRHLRNLLVGNTPTHLLFAGVKTHSPSQKPIPLNTPTVLELEPGNHIQVTLFDANHCPGAVMFRKQLASKWQFSSRFVNSLKYSKAKERPCCTQGT